MDSSVDISPDEVTSQDRGDCGADETACARPSKPPPTELAHPEEHTFVQELVSQNKVVVFSKTSCPHCDDSKSLLSGMGVEYKTVELDQIQDGWLVQNVLGSITNARTVPRIFIDGQCVGGNSDLMNLDRSGQLEDLLRNAQE